MNPHIESTVQSACDKLPTRCSYARDVIAGYQKWSGADLKGKAGRFGGSYARQRNKARTAWHQAGGRCLSLTRGHGRIVSAVFLCVDDYGRQVFATPRDGLQTADNLKPA